MKKTVIWLLALLLLCTAAHALILPADLTEIGESAFEGDESLQGVVVLPEGTTAVGERAFADTDVYALQVPAGCTVGADALSGADAAYIRLAQYAALDAAVLDDVAYVFVEDAGEAVLTLPYMHTENTVMLDSLICLAAEDGLYPLCPADRTALPETVVIPKLVDERPVVSLDMLVMPGCEGTTLLAPAYMSLPQGQAAERYQTMSASMSVRGDEALAHGTEYTFEASVEGAYGACGLLWTFTLGGETVTLETTETTCTYTPAKEGELTVSVCATDALGDTAQAEAVFGVSCGGVTLTQPAADKEPSVGTEVTFTTEAACGCDIIGYTWTITDGTNTVTYDTTEPVLVWTPDSQGHRILYVKATDAAGNTAEMALEFIAVCGGVTLTQPAADKEPSVGTEVTFTTESVCDCEITGYTWTITDGTIPETFETTEPTLAYTPLYAGSYTLTVTATDAAGNAAEVSLNFDVPCRGIAVEISAADEFPVVGSETTFSASAICDCDIVSYTWMITDGANIENYETTEPMLAYTPVSVGSHTLTVTVTDAEENTAEAVCTFETSCRGVRIEAPTADSNPAIGMETIFTANATCDCGIVSYTWTITDDAVSTSFTTTDSTCVYTPTVMGSCLVAVTATDASGASASAEMVFDVLCRGVTITQPAADAAPVVGTEVTFTTTATCDCGITGYTWTITDGTASETFETTEPKFAYTPLSAGSYTLTVAATDAAGNTAEASLSFDVACRGVAGTGITMDGKPVVGSELTFTADAACDCGISSVIWSITYSDGSVTFNNGSLSCVYTPEKLGEYNVIVTVTDEAGNEWDERTSFTVLCGNVTVVPPTADAEPALGTEMTFTTTATCDCEIVSYTWEVTGTNGSTTAVTTEPTLALTPEYADIYTLTVTAVDQQGNTASASSGFVVPCSGLTAETPQAADGMRVGQETVLSVMAACDCNVLFYDWTIEAGTQQLTYSTTVPNLTFTPESMEPHLVTVIITDALGGMITVEATIDVSCGGVTIAAPTAQSDVVIGEEAVFVTEATCDCTIVRYDWTITDGDLIIQETTEEPSITYTPAGDVCIVSVTATDAQGGYATAYSEFVLVDYGEPVYRAVLIGNTYPDTSNELAGCDTDVYAMRSVLGGMTGTPFTVTAQLNQTASGMQSAISSAFADADANDVSLFYYSGHGTSTGMLVGTSGTYVSSSTLRTWLDEVPGTKIVILDCCYSGMTIAKSEGSTSLSSFNSAVISAFSAISREGELATNGYYVLTACSKTQTSMSLSDGTISFGAFTYSLCYGSGYDEWYQEALSSMPADSNGDGAITISEAISGIQERITYLNTMIDLPQAMQYYGDTSFTLWSK